MGYVIVVVVVAMMLQTRGASSRVHVRRVSFTIDQIALTSLGTPPNLFIHARATYIIRCRH